MSQVSALTSRISKMPLAEVTAEIQKIRAAPYPKLPPSIEAMLPKTPEEKKIAFREANPVYAASLETFQTRMEELTKKVEEKPINWDKFKKYVPAPIVDHLKAEHTRKAEYLAKIKNPEPIMNLYYRALLEESIVRQEEAEQAALQLWEVCAQIDKIEKLKADLSTVTIDEIHERFPEIAAQVNKDIENGVWNIEDLPEEVEEHH